MKIEPAAIEQAQVRSRTVPTDKMGNYVPSSKATKLGQTPEIKIKWPSCAYCSMKAVSVCDAPECNTVMCAKHNHKEGALDCCREHRVKAEKL